MDMDIAGKNALVTGGSRGLGRQAALSLAAEGVNVAICGRSQETLDRTVAELKDLSVSAIGVEADVSDADNIEPLYRSVSSNLGEIDILVNNVGGVRVKEDILGTSLEDFRATFDLNLFGGYHLMQLAIPHMREQKWGRVVNIVSIWGREYGGNIGYMSAKAAVIAATKHAGGDARQGTAYWSTASRPAPSLMHREAGRASRTTTRPRSSKPSSSATCPWVGSAGRSPSATW